MSASSVRVKVRELRHALPGVSAGPPIQTVMPPSQSNCKPVLISLSYSPSITCHAIMELLRGAQAGNRLAGIEDLATPARDCIDVVARGRRGGGQYHGRPQSTALSRVMTVACAILSAGTRARATRSARSGGGATSKNPHLRLRLRTAGRGSPNSSSGIESTKLVRVA